MLTQMTIVLGIHDQHGARQHESSSTSDETHLRHPLFPLDRRLDVYEARQRIVRQMRFPSGDAGQLWTSSSQDQRNEARQRLIRQFRYLIAEGGESLLEI